MRIRLAYRRMIEALFNKENQTMQTMTTRMRTARLPIAAMLLAGVVSACASTGKMSDADKLALYRAHAGEPVDSFRTLGSGITGWTPLTDQAIAVWTRPSEAWLLDLDGGCSGIRFAQAIGLDDSTGRVSARFDRVHVRDSGGMGSSCQITAIRPLDVSALKQAQRELRQVTRAQASGT